ncbi:hypothetical protein FI667_g4772, partial [Globisporangium splendens]
MNGGLSVPNIRTELMTMSAAAVSKWAITTSHIDQVIGEILLHNTRASSTYITPLDATPRRPPQLRDSMWATGAALCASLHSQPYEPRERDNTQWDGEVFQIDLSSKMSDRLPGIIAEGRKLRGTFCAEWLPYMTSTADGWLLDSNGSPYKLAHTSLSVGTAQLEITVYMAQTLLRLKANRLSMWNYEKTDLSCSNPECSQVVQSSVQHLFWECPKAKLVWNCFYALWAKIGITPGHDPAIWIFSLDLPDTPRHAWTTIKRHIIGHKCSHEHLQDHLYPVAHMLWRYMSASLIQTICLIWAASMSYTRKDTTNNFAEYWGLIHGLEKPNAVTSNRSNASVPSTAPIGTFIPDKSTTRGLHRHPRMIPSLPCLQQDGGLSCQPSHGHQNLNAGSLPNSRAAFNNLTQDLDNDVMHWLMRSSEDPRSLDNTRQPHIGPREHAILVKDYLAFRSDLVQSAL